MKTEINLRTNAGKAILDMIITERGHIQNNGKNNISSDNSIKRVKINGDIMEDIIYYYYNDRKLYYITETQYMAMCRDNQMRSIVDEANYVDLSSVKSKRTKKGDIFYNDTNVGDIVRYNCDFWKVAKKTDTYCIMDKVDIDRWSDDKSLVYDYNIEYSNDYKSKKETLIKERISWNRASYITKVTYDDVLKTKEREWRERDKHLADERENEIRYNESRKETLSEEDFNLEKENGYYVGMSYEHYKSINNMSYSEYKWYCDMQDR